MDVKDLPMEYDVLLTDLKSKDLHESVAANLGVKYLSEVGNVAIQQSFTGKCWGPYDRPMIPIDVAKNPGAAKIVFFLFDTGSPFTYLSDEVICMF